jgi:hypothetical protein
MLCCSSSAGAADESPATPYILHLYARYEQGPSRPRWDLLEGVPPRAAQFPPLLVLAPPVVG